MPGQPFGRNNGKGVTRVDPYNQQASKGLVDRIALMVLQEQHDADGCGAATHLTVRIYIVKTRLNASPALASGALVLF